MKALIPVAHPCVPSIGGSSAIPACPAILLGNSYGYGVPCAIGQQWHGMK